MKYKLGENIKTLNGEEDVRDYDPEIVKKMLQTVFRTVNEIFDDALPDSLSDDQAKEVKGAITNELQEKLHDNLLGNTLTYREAIRRALLQFKEGEKPSEDDQLKRYDLLMDLVADNVDLEVSDVQLIRECVAATYKHPILVGRIRDKLERINQDEAKEIVSEDETTGEKLERVE